MKVYCVHKEVSHSKTSNHYQCHFCKKSWYGWQPAPLVVIGSTDPYEASPDYAKQFEPKDLSKKKFIQCNICKDLVEKRKHIICAVKFWWRKFLHKTALFMRLK